MPTSAFAPPPRPSAFGTTASSIVQELIAGQTEAIQNAAELLAASIAADGVIHAYGTGHSRAVTLEMSGRAGGLACVSMLAVKDLVMFGGADPATILDPTLEREPGLADRVLALADIRPQDAFVVVSNSGINSAVVEFARRVHDAGHPLVAITSRRHTTSTTSRDGSGERLIDHADVVIDNLAPQGDATLDIGNGRRIGAVSSLTGVLIIQLLVEEICRRLIEQDIEPPVFVSANLPEGDASNAALFARYAGRVRPIEP